MRIQVVAIANTSYRSHAADLTRTRNCRSAIDREQLDLHLGSAALQVLRSDCGQPWPASLHLLYEVPADASCWRGPYVHESMAARLRAGQLWLQTGHSPASLLRHVGPDGQRNTADDLAMDLQTGKISGAQLRRSGSETSLPLEDCLLLGLSLGLSLLLLLRRARQ